MRRGDVRVHGRRDGDTRAPSISDECTATRRVRAGASPSTDPIVALAGLTLSVTFWCCLLVALEQVLHPVFEEDEWKLIGVGGLLGMAVGTFQSVFVFQVG